MSQLVLTSSTSSEGQGYALRRALAIEPLHLVGLLTCVLVFSSWLVTESAALPVLAVVYFGVLMLSAYYLGRLVLHWIPLESGQAHTLPLVLLTGSLTWTFLMLGTHSLLPGSLRWHTMMLFAVSAGGQWVIYRRTAPFREERAAAWVSLYVVLFSLAAATCWARGLLHPIHEVENQVEFRHWMDYFDHTAFTTQFLAREHLWQYGHKELFHTPTPLYHYGSYLGAAGLASFSRLPTYDLVVSFWTPFGTFLTGLAAFVLATAFGGRTAGVCAVVALHVLPDASFYGLKNGWFGYHWLQQLASAGMYGVANSALALVFLLEARRTRSRLALLLGCTFAAGTFFLKAQVFVALLPFLVTWLVLCYPTFSIAWRLLLMEAVCALAFGGILVSNKLHLGPHIEANQHYFEHYCQYAATQGIDGAFRNLVDKGAAPLGRSLYYLAATSFILLSTFGALVGIVPLLNVWAWWTKKLHAADLAPWLVMLVYVVFLVGLNDSVVGITQWELIHRPFVWAYFVVMVWCAGKCSVLLRDTRLVGWTLNPKLLCAASVLLLLVPWHKGLAVQEGRLTWRTNCSDLRFPRGLVECGRFVARNGSRLDVVQDSHYDERLVFGSLSERRSYLARPMPWRCAKNPAIPEEVDRREAQLEKFKTLTTTAQIQEFVARTGIRWYLVHPDDHLPWPNDLLDHPAYRSDGFAVYDLSQLRNEHAAADRGDRHE